MRPAPAALRHLRRRVRHVTSIQLALGSLVLYPLGQALMDARWTASAIVQVAFAWIVGFGRLGLFHRYLSDPSFRVRWLSDASYRM